MTRQLFQDPDSGTAYRQRSFLAKTPAALFRHDAEETIRFLQQQAATVAGFAIGKDGATVLHTGQCVNSSTHYLVARFAFYVGDQAET
ncbi:hypothetical protein HR12_20370, partial [Microbacterium sp. SUBG005]